LALLNLSVIIFWYKLLTEGVALVLLSLHTTWAVLGGGIITGCADAAGPRRSRDGEDDDDDIINDMSSSV